MTGNIRRGLRRSERIAKRAHPDAESDIDEKPDTAPTKRLKRTIAPRMKAKLGAEASSPADSEQQGPDNEVAAEGIALAPLPASKAVSLEGSDPGVRRAEQDAAEVQAGQDAGDKSPSDGQQDKHVELVRTLDDPASGKHEGSLSDGQQENRTDKSDAKTADPFLRALIINIESRRMLRQLSRELKVCKQRIERFQDSEDGIKELTLRLQQLEDDEHPEATEEINEAGEMLQRQKAVVGALQEEAELMSRQLNHGAKDQKRRELRLYEMSDNAAFMSPTVQFVLPAEFFRELEGCRSNLAECQRLQQCNRTLDRKRAETNDKIDITILSLVNLRSKTINATEEQMEEQDNMLTRLKALRGSNGLAGLADESERLAAAIDNAETKQFDLDKSLHRLAEKVLVAARILPAAEKAAEPKPSRRKEAVQPDARAALREGCATARRAVIDCEKRLDNMNVGYKLDPQAQPTEGSPEELSHAFLRAKQRCTRGLIAAEAEYKDILRNAREAGVPGLEPKTSDFTDLGSCDYELGHTKAVEESTDRAKIWSWLGEEPPASDNVEDVFALADVGQALGLTAVRNADGHPVGFDLLFGGGPIGHEHYEEEPSVPEDAKSLDLRSFGFGESISVVAAGKTRPRVDGWQDRQASDRDRQAMIKKARRASV